MATGAAAGAAPLFYIGGVVGTEVDSAREKDKARAAVKRPAFIGTGGDIGACALLMPLIEEPKNKWTPRDARLGARL